MTAVLLHIFYFLFWYYMFYCQTPNITQIKWYLHESLRFFSMQQYVSNSVERPKCLEEKAKKIKLFLLKNKVLFVFK